MTAKLSTLHRPAIARAVRARAVKKETGTGREIVLGAGELIDGWTAEYVWLPRPNIVVVQARKSERRCPYQVIGVIVTPTSDSPELQWMDTAPKALVAGSTAEPRILEAAITAYRMELHRRSLSHG